MFFFLSKTLNFFTTPIVIICIIFLLALLLRSRKWKLWLLRSGVVILLFTTNDFISNEALRFWEVPATPIAGITKKYEWGIILSGVVKPDMELKDRVYFQRGADRALHAFKLYKLGIIKKILISGGAASILGETQPEADEIASVLVMMGARPEDIMTENNSRNTHESAVEVAKLLAGKTTPDQCLLFTSAFHMKRSRACFAKVGWDMDQFSTDFLAHARKFSIDVLFVPHVEALANWHVLTKEWVGFVAYFIAGYI